MTEKLRAPWTMYTSETNAFMAGEPKRGALHNVPTLAIQYDPALPYPGDGRKWMIGLGSEAVPLSPPIGGLVVVSLSHGDVVAVRVSDLTEIPTHPERGPDRRLGERRVMRVDPDGRGVQTTFGGRRMGYQYQQRQTPERRKDWPEGGR